MINLQLDSTDVFSQSFEWAHDHTKEIEAIRYALEGVGIAFILIGALSNTVHALPIIAGGALIIAIVEITIFALDLLGILAIDPKEHAFEIGSIHDSSLYYEGDLPILKIRAQSHFEAGYDHGYLIAHQLVSVFRRMKLLFCLGYLVIDQDLYSRLDSLKKSIPSQYLEEMEGLIEGVHDRLDQDTWWHSTYTLEDILTLHLLPDLMHLAITPPKFLMGCTAIMGKDQGSDEIGVGRNLDWPGLGAGRMSLLIDIKVGEEKQLLLPTIPGTVGVITGMNRNMFVSINVTEPKEGASEVKEDGTLSLFLNRQVLEQCDTLADVEHLSPDAAVPYHMFVADRTGGVIYHFGQGESGETVVRPFDSSKEPHFILNCRHQSPEPLEEPNTMYYGESRFNNVHKIWSKYDQLPLLERLKKVLSAPGVNNPMTVHSVIWMGDRLIFSFDNSYSATSPRHVVFLNQQFEDYSGLKSK